jgi:hypothetical protein
LKKVDNILGFPERTIVDSVVPKTKFYYFMEVNPRMKTHFVNDVESIRWLYKLSPDTLNVTASPDMIEIEVFVAMLKQADCPTDLFTFMDTNMPRHLVFILQYEANSMLLINYKQWKDDTHTQFRITQMFASPWVPTSSLSLKIDGQSLPRIYDNFVAQVSGIGEHQAGSMEEIVALQQQIAKAQKELETLEKRMRRELQVNLQMEMHKQVKAKRLIIEQLNNELINLK